MPANYMGLLPQTGFSQAKHVKHTLLGSTRGNMDFKPGPWLP